MAKLPLRWCLPMPGPVEIVKQQNGRFKFDGFIAPPIEDLHTFFYRRFNLTEITKSLDNYGCQEKIQKNLTDFAGDFSIVGTETDHSTVPAPIMSRKLVLASGYNYTDYQRSLQQRVVGTALENFGSFSFYIYLAFAMVIVSIFGVVFAEKLLKIKRRRKRIRYIRVLRTLGIALKQFTSDNLIKWTQFCVIMTLFVFTLLFSFAFQSQQLIFDPPKVIKSFDEMISRPNCTPIFFNSLNRDSDLFKYAQTDSMREKVWQKGISLGPEKSFVFEGMDDLSKATSLIKNFTAKVFRQEAIFISTQYTMRWFADFSCSFSEEYEIFAPMVQEEETEGTEELIGYTLRSDYNPIKQLVLFERILLENGLIKHWWDSVQVDFGYEWHDISKSHKQKQKLLCSLNSILQDANDEIIYPNLAFLKSFIYLMFVIFTISTYMLLGEIIYDKVQSKKKSRINYIVTRNRLNLY